MLLRGPGFTSESAVSHRMLVSATAIAMMAGHLCWAGEATRIYCKVTKLVRDPASPVKVDLDFMLTIDSSKNSAMYDGLSQGVSQFTAAFAQDSVAWVDRSGGKYYLTGRSPIYKLEARIDQGGVVQFEASCAPSKR